MLRAFVTALACSNSNFSFSASENQKLRRSWKAYVLPKELLWPPDKEDTEFLMTLGMEVLAWSLRVAILDHPRCLWKNNLYEQKHDWIWIENSSWRWVISYEQGTGASKVAPRLSHLTDNYARIFVCLIFCKTERDWSNAIRQIIRVGFLFARPDTGSKIKLHWNMLQD